MRRDTKDIDPEHYVFLRSEKKNDIGHRRKLAPLAKGPYLEKSVNTDSRTLVIVGNNEKMEKVSLSCVLLEPDKLTANELREDTRPMTINEIIRDYPVCEAVNLVQRLTQRRHQPPTEVFIPAQPTNNSPTDSDSVESYATDEEAVLKRLEDIISNTDYGKFLKNQPDDKEGQGNDPE